MFEKYRSSKILLDSSKKRRYIEATVYPTIDKLPDDTYIITTIGDRLDTLAFIYYKDVSLWWWIAAANPDIVFDSLYLEPGIQIRIPAFTSSGNIYDQIEAKNSSR